MILLMMTYRFSESAQMERNTKQLRKTIALIMSDGRERTATDVINRISGYKGAQIRYHLIKIYKMGLLKRQKIQSGSTYITYQYVGNNY